MGGKKPEGKEKDTSKREKGTYWSSMKGISVQPRGGKKGGKAEHARLLLAASKDKDRSSLLEERKKAGATVAMGEKKGGKKSHSSTRDTRREKKNGLFPAGKGKGKKEGQVAKP